MVFPWNKPRSDKIFINYRRDDASGFAGRLSDTLANYFGRNRVFRDVTGIDYGHDFSQVIDQKLAESGAVAVLIGEKWCSSVKGGQQSPTRQASDGWMIRPIT